MDEKTKYALCGFGISFLIFAVVGMFAWLLLSLAASEIANNCFLAGQGYEVNYICLELSNDPEQIEYCRQNMEKSLAIAKENMCEPKLEKITTEKS